MKIYDLVKSILEQNNQARNSDKECIWQVYRKLGIVKEVEWFGSREAIIKENFLAKNVPSSETIRRSRQKIQELYPELQATSSQVRKRRRQKQDTKGTFIYRETYDC